MEESQILFKENQLLTRRLLQAKLEKAGISSALPERPSVNDLAQSSSGEQDLDTAQTSETSSDHWRQNSGWSDDLPRNASEVCSHYSLHSVAIG